MVLAVALAAACGSTVPGADRPGAPSALDSPSGRDQGSGQDLPPDGGLDPVDTGSVAGPGGGRGRQVVSPPTTPVGPGPGPRPSTPPGGTGLIPAGKGARGVTDSEIKIGVVTLDAGVTTDVASGVAGSAIPVPDFKKLTQAVVDHLNANGGIAGRKVVPVYHQVNTAVYTQQSGRQREQQQACAHWTEDEPVFAFSGHGMYEEVALECAARTGTVMVSTSAYVPPSQERYDQMADVWYAPHGFVSERRERLMAEGLLAQGFFGQSPKVALMVEGRPDIRAGVEKGMKPVLAAAGVRPVLEIAYPDQIQSPWPNYVLQLQAAGVTHVVFSSTTGGSLPARFLMRAAEDQRYRPFWAIGSEHTPRSLGDGAPHAQLVKARGVGWQPYNDVLQAVPVSANDQLCRDLMRKIGEDEMAGGFICEVLFFLRDSLARAPEISPVGLSAAMDTLGTDFQSQFTIGGVTRFSRTRHDGPSQYRSFTFDDQCGQEGAACFRYIGDVKPIEG